MAESSKNEINSTNSMEENTNDWLPDAAPETTKSSSSNDNKDTLLPRSASAPIPTPNVTVHVTAPAASVHDDTKYCWVCFATDEDDNLAAWVQPCKCIGTTKWVHQHCLQRWVDVKQRGNSFKRVNCPQCQSEYIIVFPPTGPLIGMMEGFDAMIRRLCPFLAAGVFVGSLYWTAVTYGAITILQIIGHKEGLDMMEQTDPFMLLIGLPTIPVGLVIGRLFRWEDIVLRFIQNRQISGRKFQLLSLFIPINGRTSSSATDTTAAAANDILPGGGGDNDGNNGIGGDPAYSNSVALSTSVSASRILCGAMLLPTFSTIFGRLFFDSIQNNVHRTIMGGLTFIVIKGAIKIYFQQQQFHRRRQRKILEYTEENVQKFGPKAAAAAAAANDMRQHQQFGIAAMRNNIIN